MFQEIFPVNILNGISHMSHDICQSIYVTVYLTMFTIKFHKNHSIVCLVFHDIVQHQFADESESFSGQLDRLVAARTRTRASAP